MKQYGFPVGPVTLLDEVGIDVGAHVAHDLAPFFATRFGPTDTALLDDMVRAGFLGRKSGKGFFLYEDKRMATKGAPLAVMQQGVQRAVHTLIARAQGKREGRAVNEAAIALLKQHGERLNKRNSAVKIDDTEIQERIAFRMINEAVQCLEDGILEDPVDGDIGAVFGLGFPPFRGGPFRTIDAIGASHVTATLERFAAKYGPRFKPAALLVEHARRGTKFHAGK